MKPPRRRVTRTSQLRIDASGMREESLAIVRTQRERGEAMRPLEIMIAPDLTKPFLADGRHRLAVARERGDQTIAATLRQYGPRGGLLYTSAQVLRIDD